MNTDMQPEQIHVIIDKTGKVHMTVRGVKGQQCCALTKELEDALGGQISSREATPEFYEEERLAERQEIRIQ